MQANIHLDSRPRNIIRIPIAEDLNAPIVAKRKLDLSSRQAVMRVKIERLGTSDRVTEVPHRLPEFCFETSLALAHLTVLLARRQSREHRVSCGVTTHPHAALHHLPHHLPRHPMR